MTITADRPAADDATASEVGKWRLRKEDRRLITGRSRFTDNFTLPGMLYLGMVRSPFAHARILAIDVDEAKAAPGVLAVYTGGDLADTHGGLPCAWPIMPDQKAPEHKAVAVDHVSFAGEIVAVVVARSAAAARDAIELVDIDYEDLPIVLDLEAAAAGAPYAHPELGTNVSAHWVFDSGEAGSGTDARTTIEAARSDGIVLERTYRQQRLIPAFMEPRSTVVDPTGEQITMWSATQVPHLLRLMLALTTSIPEHKIRVVAPDVGGGFGGKLQVTPEEVLTLVIANKLGKPVKYTETRSESLMGGTSWS